MDSQVIDTAPLSHEDLLFMLGNKWRFWGWALWGVRIFIDDTRWTVYSPALLTDMMLHEFGCVSSALERGFPGSGDWCKRDEEPMFINPPMPNIAEFCEAPVPQFQLQRSSWGKCPWRSLASSATNNESLKATSLRAMKWLWTAVYQALIRLIKLQLSLKWQRNYGKPRGVAVEIEKALGFVSIYSLLYSVCLCG
jgi:hypothetical protein